MFFRRQNGRFRETDRVTRYKLIKSGKHWLRASTSLFGLFKVMRGGVDTTQVMTEVVEDKVNHSITGLDIIRRSRDHRSRFRWCCCGANQSVCK